MAESIFKLLANLSEIFADRISSETTRKVYELKKEYDHENAKDYLTRDHSRLDHIHAELLRLADLYSAELQRSHVVASPK